MGREPQKPNMFLSRRLVLAQVGLFSSNSGGELGHLGELEAPYVLMDGWTNHPGPPVPSADSGFRRSGRGLRFSVSHEISRMLLLQAGDRVMTGERPGHS